MPKLNPEKLQAELCVSGQALRQLLSAHCLLLSGWGSVQQRTSLQHCVSARTQS